MDLQSLPAWLAREQERQTAADALAAEIERPLPRFRRVLNFEFPLLNKLARRARDKELIGLTLQHHADAEASSRRRFVKGLTAISLAALALVFYQPPRIAGSLRWLASTFLASGQADDKSPVGRLRARYSRGYDIQVLWPERVWIGYGKELSWQSKYKSDDFAALRNKFFGRVPFPSLGTAVSPGDELIAQSIGKVILSPRGAGSDSAQGMAGEVSANARLAKQQALFERAIGRRGDGVQGRNTTVFMGSGSMVDDDQTLLTMGGADRNARSASSPGWRGSFQADNGSAIAKESFGLPHLPLNKAAAFQGLENGNATQGSGAIAKSIAEFEHERRDAPTPAANFTPLGALPSDVKDDQREYPDFARKK